MTKKLEPPVRSHHTLGACGIDCSLCPRFQSNGSSKCPGCAIAGFYDRRPACAFLNCAGKRKFEFCSQCYAFPCFRFADRQDSFVTKQRCAVNLLAVQKGGLGPFLEQQKQREKLLEKMLLGYNEGRSKSFYCLAVALLPVSDIEGAIAKTEQAVKDNNISRQDIKSKAGILRNYLSTSAGARGIELKLRIRSDDVLSNKGQY